MTCSRILEGPSLFRELKLMHVEEQSLHQLWHDGRGTGFGLRSWPGLEGALPGFPARPD